MAAAAVTAIRGRRARARSRVRAVPRGLWRLLILLGLAWIGCLLLGATAYASDAPSPSPAATTHATTAPTSVVDQVLDTTDALVPALPVRSVVAGVTEPVAAQPVTTVDVPVAGTAVTELPPTVTETVEPVAAPASESLETVKETVASSKAVAATTGHDVARAPELPHLTDVVSPVVAGAGAGLRSAVATTVDAVEKVAAPVPLVGSVSRPLGATTREVVEAVTRLADTTTYAAAAGVDAAIVQATPLLSPVLSPVVRTLTVIGQLGIAGAASGSSSSVPAAAGDTATAPTSTIPAPGVGADIPLDSQSQNGPAVPPPDATAAASSTVQSASATDTTLAVPVSDAGSTVSGSGGSGSGSAGGPEFAKVLAGRLGRNSAGSVAPKTEAPIRPMPGTPLADPGFSPD